MARNRSIYARTFFPWRLSVLRAFYVIVEKPTATLAVQQLDVEPQIVETRWPPGHVIVRTYMPIGNRDASLLSIYGVHWSDHHHRRLPPPRISTRFPAIRQRVHGIQSHNLVTGAVQPLRDRPLPAPGSLLCPGPWPPTQVVLPVSCASSHFGPSCAPAGPHPSPSHSSNHWQSGPQRG